MARYLVVANQTLGGAELERVVRDRIRPGEGRFYIVVPTIDPEQETAEWNHGFTRGADAGRAPAVSERTREAQEMAARRRVELVGQAQARAESRLRRMIDMIEAAGGHAEGEVGGPDPVAAVEAVLRRHRFAEVIISTLPAGLSRWLKMDLPSRVSRMTDTPVTTVEAEA
jgi:hypothetical protein